MIVTIVSYSQEFTMEISEQESVLEIKKRLGQFLQIPTSSLTLFVSCWELLDGLDIDDYPIISHGTRIDLTVTPLFTPTSSINPAVKRIHITVKFPSKQFTVEVDRTETVSSLKDKIHIVENTPIKRMQLYYSGVELADDYRNLNEYGISEFSEIVVFLKSINRAKDVAPESKTKRAEMSSEPTNMVPVLDNNGDDGNNENNNIDNTNGGADFGDEEFDSANTISDNPEEAVGNNEEDPRPPHKKKRYNRHSQFQIQEMEAFFRECPHPDDKQRKELSCQIGLDPLQIKFWFQNKRTPNKNQLERLENTELRTANNKLRAENLQYREAILQALCPKCGGHTAIGDMSFEEHHLRIENARLNEEIKHMTALAARFMARPVTSCPQMAPPVRSRALELGKGTIGRDVYGNGGNHSREIIGPAENDKPRIVELAVVAMEELMVMAQVCEPLWMGGVNGTSLALNLDEYTRNFRKGLGPRLNGFRTEASRDTALVAMNPTSIVEMLMQENLWSTMFAGMIGRAMTHEEILARVAGNFNGALQIMSAEYQVLSPLVSTRKSYFARYSKQQGEGLWAVVDVSIDHLLPNMYLNCRRRPSGCLIQETHSGYSKVTWVEHVEVDDRGANHHMYRHLICSGQALGANRWVATLERQCERISSIMSTDFQSGDSGDLIMLTNHGKTSILKLAERMARSFFAGLTTSMGTATFSGGVGDDIKVMTMKNLNDPGRPPGVVLCAATSFWVPVPPKTVFDFLRDENNRTKWDVLSAGGIVQKISEIPNGRDSRNCATLLRNANTCQSKMMIVQESSTDPTASFLIYAPVDTASMEIVLNGGDSDYVALLPSGFAIFPDGMVQPGGEGGGSLLTVAFQMLVESGPSTKLSVSSVATVENLIRSTVLKIKALFPCQTA